MEEVPLFATKSEKGRAGKVGFANSDPSFAARAAALSG
jgi:hypothetical protein